jgi:hypothetical protein
MAAGIFVFFLARPAGLPPHLAFLDLDRHRLPSGYRPPPHIRPSRLCTSSSLAGIAAVALDLAKAVAIHGFCGWKRPVCGCSSY